MDQTRARAYLQVANHYASTFEGGTANPFAVQKLKAALKGLESELFPAGNKKPASNSALTPKRVSQ